MLKSSTYQKKMKTKMKTIHIKLIAIIGFAFFTLQTNAQIDRSKMPTPGPEPEINLEKPTEFKLKNGITVLVVENNKLPRVSYQLSIDNKPYVEGNKAGVANLLSSMLGNGTTSISKEDFNEEVDFLGANINFGSSGGFGSGLVKYSDRIVELMADATMNPLLTEEEFIKETKDAVSQYYPTLKDNEDYTSVINEKHYDRLKDLLNDAIEKGAHIDEINPSNEDFSQQEFYKIPPTIVTNTSDDMKIMQEEIFGPLLPVVEYDEIDEATALINSKDRPLGLYYFGNNTSEENDLLNKTSSGGVTVNNVISHLQQNDLSFGGVGPSGMGRYKSFEGFKNFSNPRAYYKDVGFKLDKFFDAVRPPYKGDIEKVLKQLMK